MSSTEQRSGRADAWFELTPEQGRLLPRLARHGIAHRLETGEPLPRPSGLAEPLTRPGAAFVSLYRAEGLRGCMGTLLAERPLVDSVLDAALDAALGDPRFPPVERDELDALTITVPVLSEPQAMAVSGEQDLLEQLQPGEDGLILHDGKHRATFLPAVWEQLPDPQDFLAQLKAKAGLPPDHWSPTLQFARYRSLSFTDPPPQERKGA